MEDLVKNTFSLAICFALTGGLLGSLLIIDYKRYGLFMTIVLVLMGMVLAASLNDYFFPPTRPWQYAGVGILSGIASMALLDAFKMAAPKLAKQVIKVLSVNLIKIIEYFFSNKKDKK